jgi:predicted small integral membrane protein
MLIQFCKVLLVATIALLFTLIALGNLVDPNVNWLFVQHVLQMDTIFPDATIKWRAIHDKTLQATFYSFIIIWEAGVALILWYGVAQLLRYLKDRAKFNAGKSIAIFGLTMGFILYAAGFITIGGEWFAMWQSTTWNGEESATRFLTIIGLVLLFLIQREAE